MSCERCPHRTVIFAVPTQTFPSGLFNYYLFDLVIALGPLDPPVTDHLLGQPDAKVASEGLFGQIVTFCQWPNWREKALADWGGLGQAVGEVYPPHHSQVLGFPFSPGSVPTNILPKQRLSAALAHSNAMVSVNQHSPTNMDPLTMSPDERVWEISTHVHESRARENKGGTGTQGSKARSPQSKATNNVCDPPTP